MYVEEVCIDGFKSYAQRTVVPQFDQYFNAITGLNGSGKSNILDSICFVLGITNLSQVRNNARCTLAHLEKIVLRSFCEREWRL
jgi:chromosome segregation ATPase